MREHVLRRNVRILGERRVQLRDARELVRLRLRWVRLPDRASHARANGRSVVPEHMLRRNVRVLGECWLQLRDTRELVRLRLRWVRLPDRASHARADGRV